ncbi:MAG: hypothetical protein ACK5Q7_02975 [Cyanobacteriota bacterium]|jgi:hypothetical protein
MSIAFQCLLMMVLLVSGSVAFFPLQLLQPEPRRSATLPSGLQRSSLWIVENPKGQWFVNGAPHTLQDLQGLLQRARPQSTIRYLPSDALPLERVTRSLQKLRSLAPGSVVLDLVPGVHHPR